MSNTLLCPWESPFLFLFSSDPGIPHLLYYSYIPLIILSIFFTTYIFIKSKKSILSIILLTLAIIFSLWLLNEIITWTENKIPIQMFSWQLVRFFEISIFTTTAFFCSYFFSKGNISFVIKILLFILPLPVLFLLSTKFNIESFYLSDTDCGGNYGQLYLYVYIAQIISFFTILISAIVNYKNETEKNFKKQILIVLIGTLCFLIIMLSVSIFSDTVLTYQINLIGPIGMFAFITLLAFMIVRYKTFNIKLLATQALVWGLAVLIGSQFFFIKNPTNYILNSITFVGIIVFGQFLIKSVKREVKQKEEIQKIAVELEQSNTKLTDSNEKLDEANEKLK